MFGDSVAIIVQLCVVCVLEMAAGVGSKSSRAFPMTIKRLEMRTSFALDLDLRPISVNAPKDQPHVFRVGDVLWLTSDYPTPYGDVPADTKLFVQSITEDDGALWLRAEGDVPALFNWDNELVVVPYDTDDLAMCLRAAIRCPVAQVSPEDVPEEPLPPSNVRQLGKLALVAASIAISWSLSQRITAHNDFVHQGTHFQSAAGTTQLPSG